MRYVILAIALSVLTTPVSQAGPLHDAVEAGDLETVRELVNSGANLKQADPLKGTPLHVAALTGQTEIAEYLLAEGAGVRMKFGMFRYTPLHSAAVSGRTDIVALLIDNGAKTEDKDMSLNTPLHLAADAGHFDVIKLLLARGADVNAENETNATAIHHAGVAGHFEIVDFLAEQRVSSVPVEPIASYLENASVENGRRLFNECIECHTIEKGKIHRGPNLWGVFEREKGSGHEYPRYSAAITRLEGLWTYEEMNEFLADPKVFMPGTGMADFRGVEEASARADLIAFLRMNGDEPPPLP